MSMTDPVADMLTRIRNGQTARKVQVAMPAAKQKHAIAKVLYEQGYIEDYQVVEQDGRPTLVVSLKYFEGRPVIEGIDRVSRPGRRVFRGAKHIPEVIGGLGVAIVSTSRGMLTDRDARVQGLGGEVVCTVY
jgi:small subunit ribosomal protein S8